MHDFFSSPPRLTVCLYCVINSAVFCDDGARCVRSYRASDYEWNRSNLVFCFFHFSLSVARCFFFHFFPRMKTKAKAKSNTERGAQTWCAEQMCVLMWSISNKTYACVGVEHSSSAANWRFSSQHTLLTRTDDDHCVKMKRIFELALRYLSITHSVFCKFELEHRVLKLVDWLIFDNIFPSIQRASSTVSITSYSINLIASQFILPTEKNLG